MTPVPSDAIRQLVNQVAQGEVKGLKQLSQAERKVLKSSLEHLNRDKTSIDQIDKGILKKISQPENYHQNPIRSLIKGIARKLFSNYIDTNSLADFIRNNSSHILKNLEQLEKPGTILNHENSNSTTVKDVEALRQKIVNLKPHDFQLFIYVELRGHNPDDIVKLFDLHGAEMNIELERLGGDVAKEKFIKELAGLNMPLEALSKIEKILLPASPDSKAAPNLASDPVFALSPMERFEKKPGIAVPVSPSEAIQFKYDWDINPSSLPEATLNQQIASTKPEDLLGLPAKGIQVSGEQYLTAAEQYRSTIPADGNERGPMLTTLHQLYSKAADMFENEGNLVRAFEVRANASKFTLPSPGSALHNMSQAVGQGQAAQRNSNFPAHFTGLDTGILKGAALRASNRTIEGQAVTQLEFKLSKFARSDLQGHLLNIQDNLSAFEASLPPELQGKVRVTVVKDTFLGKKGDGSFGVTEGLTMKDAQAIQIEFEGVGSVIIGNSPRIGCLYNNVKVLVKAGLPEGKAQEQVHQMLTMLGVGPIMNEQRESDEERLKAALIFRTYFPKEATKMERSKEFYEMPVDILKEKITTKIPEMKSIFQKYEQNPELIQKVEAYPGKTAFAISDISQQMRANGAIGLMAGVGTSDSVALIMKNGNLSSQDRFQAGLMVIGASSEEDLMTGGGDYVFTRLINNKTIKYEAGEATFSGYFQLLYDLDVCNTGGYGHNEDKFGVKNPEVDNKGLYENRKNLFEMASDPELEMDNEIMIKNTIPPAMIRGIVCQSEIDKEELVAKLEAQGIIVDGKINGKPVDSFIHIADDFSKNMWDK